MPLRVQHEDFFVNPLDHLVVLSERNNATYRINFIEPLACSLGVPRLTGLFADELESLPISKASETIEAALGPSGTTAAVISRYTGPMAADLIRRCRRRGTAVHFHLDDWLFGMPIALGPSYAKAYGSAYLQQLTALIESTDSVLCSSAYLADLVAQRFPGHSVRTVPGVCYRDHAGGAWALKSRASRWRRRWRFRHQLLIGYAGSSSHTRDLALVAPAIERLMAEHPAVRFECFGVPVPGSIARRWPDRVASFGYTKDYDSYLRTLYELGWSLGLCPLVDDDFNRSKTPTKLLEYAAVGVPALCSRVEPYAQLLQLAPDAPACIAPDGWYEVLRNWPAQAPRHQHHLRALRAMLRQVAGPAKASAGLLTALALDAL